MITNHCEPDVIGWPRFAGFDGQNESATSRVTLAFGSFRRSVSRVCGAFVAHLSRPFRATDVRGWPLTQGGARRLRRLALPWANLFCPFGAGRFLDAWPVSAGLVVLRSPITAEPTTQARPPREIAVAERIHGATPAVAYGSAVNGSAVNDGAVNGSARIAYPRVASLAGSSVTWRIRWRRHV